MHQLGIAQQTTDTFLMVRPAHFGFNEQTAEDNAFQKIDKRFSKEEIQQKAREEFDRFVEKLQKAGVTILVADDPGPLAKPDAVFPNNWVSFHRDGRILTYPMFADLRRFERQEALLSELAKKYQFKERIHFEEFEKEDRFLESTGSMILDREHRLAYACPSIRTDLSLLELFCKTMSYEPVTFTAVDHQGLEIYHTNVMMALGETFVIICMETIRDEKEKHMLREKFSDTGKEVIDITLPQMMAFAGNMLQVRNRGGEKILVMSEQAFRSLSDTQIARIETHCQILHSPLYTIETFGGGSARCMMAEVFYPVRPNTV